MKKISILGSTGSIGQSALDVISLHQDRFEVVGLAEGHDVELMSKQIEKFKPQAVSVRDADSAKRLSSLIGNGRCEIVHGIEGASYIASLESADIVVSAIVGAAGLLPTIEAIKKGKRIALANKETMVIAGGLVKSLAKKHGALIIPVDSEHSAIHQSLEGHRIQDVRRIILTASGGPFLKYTKDELEKVTIEKALKHPKWKMGAKITIDSATLMNKGLEVIEAFYLFGIPKIDVVIHPESIIHSMVEYKDGCVISEMSVADMRAPIAYALSYPERLTDTVERLDLAKTGSLTFEEPDTDKFPCLRLAYDALETGGAAPVALNAANEVAVEAFLKGKISFTKIPKIIEKTIRQMDSGTTDTLEAILAFDKEGRKIASESI